MDYLSFTKEGMDEIKERFDLAIGRIRLMEQESTGKEPFDDYFHRTAAFLLFVGDVAKKAEDGRLNSLNIKEQKALNRALYEDITGTNYNTSYANPAYACERLGIKYGRMLAFLYTELRGTIIHAYERRIYEFTIYLELLIEVYNIFEWEDEFTYKDVKRAIYDFMNDYSGLLTANRTKELIDTGHDFAKDIIMESDLSDISYLYRFGDYITENELKTAEFLNTLPQEKIQAMADTFTEGYRLGFVAYRLDLSKKSIVNIRYQLGFERIVRCAILNFRKLGLEPSVYRAAYNVINKKQHLKIGYHATSPNKQYDYDHRFDIGLIFDKALMEKMLAGRRASFDYFRDRARLYAGPAVMEVFGEELFAPEDKKEAIRLDKRQQKLYVEYYNRDNLLSEEYFKLEETSFTIISYPVPEIGKDFKEIFDETVKVNTLDNNLYRRIQQEIIDVLDQGEYVRIIGKGANHTDMMVKLYPLEDSTKETIFENCIADVNIPVGEVFTSPVLKGTNGVLHVPKVYLNDLEYRELELTFTDGRISDYTCKNYGEEAKNKAFIKENLMFNHDYLPLGEFAIGTNTTAYRMAKKYDIAPRLPVLIAEKTGPHFAVGDTCYKMSEEVRVFNPDGKEVVARENEISSIRRTDPGKAYFNCHTDITLPYDETKEISVYKNDGSVIPVIQDARFVLAGTLSLNDAFDK